MKTFVTESYEETLLMAEKFAETITQPAVIAFIGGLGMGKTAFTAGFVKGLGIDCKVSSPTFSLCNDYIGENARVYHFDMYRVESWDDLYSTGFFDYLNTNAYILIEWSENVFGALPDDTIFVEIEKKSENKRLFKIMSKTEVSE